MLNRKIDNHLIDYYQKCSNALLLGVCNVTNHFNPFILYLDAESESWKEIALLPILPNFSWRVTF